jgi:hypothetical protein
MSELQCTYPTSRNLPTPTPYPALFLTLANVRPKPGSCTGKRAALKQPIDL